MPEDERENTDDVIPESPHFKSDPWSRRHYDYGTTFTPQHNRGFGDSLRTFGGRGYTAHRKDLAPSRHGYQGLVLTEKSDPKTGGDKAGE